MSTEPKQLYNSVTNLQLSTLYGRLGKRWACVEQDDPWKHEISGLDWMDGNARPPSSFARISKLNLMIMDSLSDKEPQERSRACHLVLDMPCLHEPLLLEEAKDWIPPVVLELNEPIHCENEYLDLDLFLGI